MKYLKDPLTYQQQAQLLIDRGLKGELTQIQNVLSFVNYYRLSGYFYPFQDKTLPEEPFKKDTHIDAVWRRYTFDRQLRIIVMDAIERVEVSVKTKLAYWFAHEHGKFDYVLAENLPKISSFEHAFWMSKLMSEIKRSENEQFVKHYWNKYGNHEKYLPIWMVVELMTFGAFLTFYKGVKPQIKKLTASEYCIPDEVLGSWIRALASVRNICAHHGRLWNRTLGYAILLPNQRKYPQWHQIQIPHNRLFGILTVCKYLLSITAPKSQWKSRLENLFNDYSDIPLADMGFPEGWQKSALWQ